MDKKGLSEIVGYVLMILISITIAGMIYGAFITFVPKDDLAKCPDEVSLVASRVVCGGGMMNISFLNKGTFNIVGFNVAGTNSLDSVVFVGGVEYESCSNNCDFPTVSSTQGTDLQFCDAGCNVRNPLTPGTIYPDDIGSAVPLKLYGGLAKVRITPIVKVPDLHNEWGGEQTVVCWDKSIVLRCP